MRLMSSTRRQSPSKVEEKLLGATVGSPATGKHACDESENKTANLIVSGFLHTITIYSQNKKKIILKVIGNDNVSIVSE